jgi:hypothetical protein
LRGTTAAAFAGKFAGNFACATIDFAGFATIALTCDGAATLAGALRVTVDAEGADALGAGATRTGSLEMLGLAE